MGRLKVGLLGPLEVTADGRPLELGGTKQRAVLAMLAIRPGVAVPIDRIIEGIWGEGAPESVRNAIQPDVLHAIDPKRIANRKGEPVLYEWPSLGAHLLFLYHPSSRGDLFKKEWDKTVVPALDYLRRNGHMPV